MGTQMNQWPVRRCNWILQSGAATGIFSAVLIHAPLSGTPSFAKKRG
jgi:hypothetical protein